MGEMIAQGIALFFLSGILILMIATWIGYFATRFDDRAAEGRDRDQAGQNQNHQRIADQVRFRQNAARIAREAEETRLREEQCRQRLLDRVVQGVAQDRATYKEKYGGK